MQENLDDSLRLMFGHEGGYVNRKSDRGGPTKYGVTHRTLAKHRGVSRVSAEQVKAMTMEEAEDIYRQSYWGQSGGDVLPSGLDYAAFDFGVNSGPQTAVKKLQDVLRKAGTYTGAIDGWIGSGTLRGVTDYPGGVPQLIKDYCARRMRYLKSLTSPKTGFPKNGRGWTIRVTGKDPKGQWADEPGVVGNALTLWLNSQDRKHQADLAMPKHGGEVSAKAEPVKKSALLQPEILAGAGTAATAAGGVLSSGVDPLKIALAVVLVGGFVLAGWFFVKRYRLLDPSDAHTG